MNPRHAVLCGMLLALAVVGGCVERVARIQTRPPGALVIVNDEEVGISPVKFYFTWYGDYDLVFRKEGYQTLKTHHRIDAPWYQIPPIDVISETLVPGMIRDVHELPVFELEPAEAPDFGRVVERAVELRERALFEGGEPIPAPANEPQTQPAAAGVTRSETLPSE